MNRLFRAGMIAIPLKPQPDSPLNPEPNFLIIESVFDFLEAPFLNELGEQEITECQNSLIKLVYREILVAKDSKPEVMREVQSDDPENQVIPLDFVPLLRNHKALIAGETHVNMLLGMFTFRGYLEGHKLQLDTEKAQEYLDYLEAIKAEKEADKQAPEEEAPAE